MEKIRWFGIAAGVGLLAALPARAQVIGSYDNFDCFNDTGTVAEGFEIDVEDVSEADITRQFPSNFSATPWVIRYGLPTMTSYDWTTSTPDAAHAYDAGHRGVLVTWAAKWNGTKWVADQGSQPYAGTVSGDGTPYVKNPSYTLGDSCWFYGLGNKYPTSGCDHFGISFAGGVAPGKMTYHWKIADPANPGTLINAALEAAIPPSPVLVVAPPVVVPNQPPPAPVVHVVAQAPADNEDPLVNPEQQYGDAYWLKTYTSYLPVRAELDALQKANVPMKNGKGKPKVTVKWSLVQKAPANNPDAEKEDAEDDAIPAGAVQVTKRVEYYRYTGAYDSETHEAICGPEGPKSNGPCTVPVNGYVYTDPNTGITKTYRDLGKYIGAHMNAYNVQ